jgi:peptide deformylase
MPRVEIQKGNNNKILRTRSEPITKVDKKVKKIIDNLHATLLAEHGLGIAAPQIGENIRVILARLNSETQEEMIKAMINPEIIYTSEETVIGEEGCLSLPELYKLVERFKKLRVRFEDIHGASHILELEDLNARIIQHEVDHINGILFIDRVKEDIIFEDKSKHDKII